MLNLQYAMCWSIQSELFVLYVVIQISTELSTLFNYWWTFCCGYIYSFSQLIVLYLSSYSLSFIHGFFSIKSIIILNFLLAVHDIRLILRYVLSSLLWCGLTYLQEVHIITLFCSTGSATLSLVTLTSNYDETHYGYHVNFLTVSQGRLENIRKKRTFQIPLYQPNIMNKHQNYYSFEKNNNNNYTYNTKLKNSQKVY